MRAHQWEEAYPTSIVDNTLNNIGIAAAQNIGISQVLKQGASHVLLLDQDSDITPVQIEELMGSFHTLETQKIRLAAISPRPYNKLTGKPYPYPCNFVAQHTDRYTEVTDLMSSGMLISATALKEVGMMEENLFIDAVDSEWCWRALHNGYRLFTDEHIHLEHMLGMGNKQLAGRTISITPPYRLYYMIRNYLWLCHRNYVPKRWKWYNGLKYIVKAIYYPLFGADHKAYTQNIWRGLKDGMRIPSK